MKYKVITKCFWNSKVWEEGEIYEGEETPPKHMILLSQYKEPVKSTARDIMAPRPMSFGPQPLHQTTGFVGGLKTEAPKPMETGPVIKGKKK
jgi:hypothetical protein